MKGKTNQPVTIAVPPQWAEHPDILALAAQGHVVEVVVVAADLFLAPHASHWREEMFAVKGALETAIKAARKRRKA